MDPQSHDEQKLRNEVIYLHSLWHQGPPTTTNPATGTAHLNVPFPHNTTQSSIWQQQQRYLNPPAIARPTYYANPYAIGRNYQYSSNYRRRKRRARGDEWDRDTRKVLLSQPDPHPSWDSGLEWPCPDPVEEPAASKSEWPAMKSRASEVSRTVSDEEGSRLMALEMQYKAIDSCREFLLRMFCSASDSDSDSDSDSERALDVEEDEDDEDMGDDGSEDCEEYKFFLKIFVEDCELRSYYEKNYEGGEFCCLVCGGIGTKNAKRRFKDGIGLVQHSLTISRTLTRRAHRAFGKVICKVIGWDVDRLPTIVLKGETLGQSLEMKKKEVEVISF